MASDEYWRRVILKAAKKDKHRELWFPACLAFLRGAGLFLSKLILRLCVNIRANLFTRPDHPRFAIYQLYLIFQLQKGRLSRIVLPLSAREVIMRRCQAVLLNYWSIGIVVEVIDQATKIPADAAVSPGWSGRAGSNSFREEEL